MKPDKIKKIIEERVVGKIKSDHTPEGHAYLLTSGTRVASVTTKLGACISKPHLIPWALRLAIEYLDPLYINGLITPENKISHHKIASTRYTAERDAAGFWGHSAHSFIEQYLTAEINGTEKPTIPGNNPPVCAAIRSFLKFMAENNIVPIASELLVGSEKLRCAGTLDFICLMDGKLTLIDFKTSNAPDTSGRYSMQLIAYKKMFEEMTGLRIKQGKILMLSKKDDNFSIWDVKDTSNTLCAFKSVSKLYDWLNNGQEKISNKKDKIIL